MTIRINFLPRSYQPPQQLGGVEWAAAAAVAVLTVSATVYYMSAFAGTARLEEGVQRAQVQLQTIQGQLALVSEIRTREEQVARAESEIKALGGRQWSGVLLILRDLTPQTVTWGSLDVTDDTMQLKATSQGLADVAQLFGGLLDHSLVEAVTLRYVNEQGSPMDVTVRKDGPSTGKQLKLPALPAAFRHFDFELDIKLGVTEGGKQSLGT